MHNKLRNKKLKADIYFQRVSLRKKLIAILILIIVVPLTFVGIITYYNLAKEFHNTIEQSSSLLIDVTNNNILSYAKSIETPLVTNSEMQIFTDCADSPDSVIKSSDKMKELYSVLKRIKDSSLVISHVYFATDSGVIIRYPADNSSYDMAKLYKYYEKMDWYKHSLKETNSIIWSTPYKNIDQNETMISSAIGVSSYDHKSVIFAEANLTRFASAAIGVMPLGKEGYIMAMLPSGEVIEIKKQELIGKKIFDEDIIKKMNASNKGAITYKNREGKTLLLFDTDQTFFWKVIAYIPEIEFYRESNKIGNLILMLSLICIAIGVSIAIFLSMSVTKPIKNLQFIMSQVAKGKVGLNLNIKAFGEIGDMVDSFKSMIISIRKLIIGIKKASSIVTKSSNEIYVSNKGVVDSGDVIRTAISEVTSGAYSQAEETESCLNSIRNLSDSINEISENIYYINTSLGRIGKVVSHGVSVSENMKQKSEMNFKISNEIVKEILALDSSLCQIDVVVKTVTSIAEQTNLLSINAAIEATKAGEAGKGFSVVAVEVRKLADNSKLSIKSISNILKKIKSDVSNIAEKAVKTGEVSEVQMVSVENSTTVFAEISEAVKTVGKEFSEILVRIEKMNIEKKNVIKNVEYVSSISEEFAKTAEEISNSIENQIILSKSVDNLINDLKALSQDLTYSVSKFELDNIVKKEVDDNSSF